MNNKIKVAILTVAISPVLMASSCSNDGSKASQYGDDAPHGTIDRSTMNIYTMSDGFSNVGTKCGPDGLRIFVLYHGDSAYGGISVVPDPLCAK